MAITQVQLRNGTTKDINDRRLINLTATVDELNYTDGVTSNILSQLDGKQPSLPTTTSHEGEFLHANETTGALEWSDAGGGDDALFGEDDILEFIDGTNIAVQANPTGTATETLNKLKVNSTIYSVGGGSTSGFKIPATLTYTDEYNIEISCDVTLAQIVTAYATYKNNIYVHGELYFGEYHVQDVILPFSNTSTDNSTFIFSCTSTSYYYDEDDLENYLTTSTINAIVDEDGWFASSMEPIIEPNASSESTDPLLTSLQFGNVTYRVDGGSGGQSASFSGNKLVFTGGTPVLTGTLTVTSLAGATVTVGTDSYTYDETETTHTFGPYEYGTYTVLATKTGMYDRSISATISASMNSCTCCPSKLPDGYTELSYIESSGTQYINVGIGFNSNTDEIRVEGQLMATDSYKWIFGSFTGSRFGLSSMHGITYNSSTYTMPTSDLMGSKHILEFNSNGAYYDNTQKVSFVSFNNTTTAYLFAVYNNGSPAGHSYSRIYLYQLKRNDSVVRNLIPAKRDSDDYIGMYDTATSTFYENSGEGTFIPGDPV